MDYEYIPNFDVDMYGYDDYGSQPMSQPINPISQLSPIKEEDNKNEVLNINEVLEPSLKYIQPVPIEESDNIPSLNVISPIKFAFSDEIEILETNNIPTNLNTDFLSSNVPSTSKKSPAKIIPVKPKKSPSKNAASKPKKSPSKSVALKSRKSPSKVVKSPSKPSTSKDTEIYKTPTNARPPINIHAKFSMKILKTQLITPQPNYKSMLDEELNDHLDKFGIRPMGKKRAIEELTRIYEATHPIVDEKTPTREKIWNAISEFNERPKKTASRKRPAPPEFDMEEVAQKPLPTMQTLTGDVLSFLRLPQNAELYNECLSLKSIMLDRLMGIFAPLLSKRSISKDVFIRILDHLHITYSDKRDENNHYYQ